MEKAKNLLLAVVKELVKHPDEISLESRTDELGVLLTLSVAKEDMGTVIGKQGNMANALRLLMHTVGTRESAKISLKIVDPVSTE